MRLTQMRNYDFNTTVQQNEVHIYLLGAGGLPASGTLKSNLNKATTEDNQIIKSYTGTSIPQTKLNRVNKLKKNPVISKSNIIQVQNNFSHTVRF